MREHGEEPLLWLSDGTGLFEQFQWALECRDSPSCLLPGPGVILGQENSSSTCESSKGGSWQGMALDWFICI